MATPTAQHQWQDRSVTPNVNNYGARYASAPRVGHRDRTQTGPYETVRSMTPNGGRFNNNVYADEGRAPSSTGLIRLSLKKPMGIVFEPMYDPNKATLQRGVRICDLPRTGAAALSRKLQVGDELLQINDTTVSRLTFDEIMDFIIEADPESVNLLFRRPRKETLQARQGIHQKINAAANKDNPAATVKWVDEEEKPKKKKKKSKKKSSKKEEEDDTLPSRSTAGEDSYVKRKKKHKKSRRGTPYESESFLDMLIDTICSDSNNVCRDTFPRNDDEYSDDESFETEEDTYETYEDSRKKPPEKQAKKKYEDDGTLETVETRDREEVKPAPAPIVPPLGLAPNPPPAPTGGEETDEEGVPAPIKELEYDDRIDHGADVSVMESLGGPSLLIEKQRLAAQQKQIVPPEIVDNFGMDYPKNGNMTREETIAADPLKFYTFVVKELLQRHEPEKVRLLDKLLAKYKGREDHLVQKLSVRYNKEETEFTEAVQKSKTSTVAAAAVNTAKERLDEEDRKNWPKEIKQPEQEDEVSESGSEYSRDSVDGTSPAVIAQVSELLNYVYGKTSVPGQIDRVSTIMRAYEGREAVLLELLETKALIKANKEKENADNLPSFLRNSVAHKDDEQQNAHQNSPVSPMANSNQAPQSGTVINDDISSMSGVSSPVVAETPDAQRSTRSSLSSQMKEGSPMKEVPNFRKPPTSPPRKKKGLFGGLFKKKAERPASRLRNVRKLNKGTKSVEGSI